MKPSLLGQLLDHRYQVIRTLASGGFGQTYVAADTRRPGQPQCVVKQLKPASSDVLFLENARRLFATEAEMLEKLGDHPQIPRLLAYFEEDEEFFLVQELIEGHPLSQELRAGRLWTTGQVYLLLWEVLQLLMFVHDQNVIHRDIKPDNLIRRRSDQQLVLVDFGTVKQVRTQLAIPGQATATIAVGTPGYMPTEQSHGKPRPNSDIYALGIIGIQAATGLTPMQLQEDPETGEIIWCDRTQIHPQLAAILSRMVRYHFRERYQTALEVLQALEPLIDQFDIDLPESWQDNPYPRSTSGRAIPGRPISGRANSGRSFSHQPIATRSPQQVPDHFQPTLIAHEPPDIAAVPQSLQPTVISAEPNPSVAPPEVVASPPQSLAATAIAIPATTSPIRETESNTPESNVIELNTPESNATEVNAAESNAIQLSAIELPAIESSNALVESLERFSTSEQAKIQTEDTGYAIESPVELKPRSQLEEQREEQREEQILEQVVPASIESTTPPPRQKFDRLMGLSPTHWLVVSGFVMAIITSTVGGRTYLAQRQEYLQVQQTLEQAQGFKKQTQYDACVQKARTITNRYPAIYRTAQVTLGECLLSRATELAKNYQLKAAIAQALQIAPTMSTYTASQNLVKQWSEQILQIATEQYRQGNLRQAESIASAIPPHTAVATKAQQLLKQWQAEWQQNEALLKTANQAIAQQEWQKALDTTDKIKVMAQPLTPTMPYWKTKVEPIATQAEQAIAAAAAAAQKAAERAAAQQQAVQFYQPPASSGYSSNSGSSGDSSGYPSSGSSGDSGGTGYSNPAPAPAPAPAQPSGGGWEEKPW